MKILVLGANGMAGHVISQYLTERDFEVYNFTRKPYSFLSRNILGNVQDISFLRETLSIHKFDVIINCVGLLNSYAENFKSDAVFVNSYLPHILVDLVSEENTKIIHMSTDCVFAGNTGPYSESSLRDGSTFYDRTKALGEIDYSNKHLTFRNSIIGPDMNPHGIGLFNWFMHQQGTIHGYRKAIWTGVTTPILAMAMEKAIIENLSGLYNLVNNDSICKYELLNLFNSYFKHNSMSILPESDFQLDKTLINTRTDFSFQVPSYEHMIENMKEWVVNHKHLYPHYLI